MLPRLKSPSQTFVHVCLSRNRSGRYSLKHAAVCGVQFSLRGSNPSARSTTLSAFASITPRPSVSKRSNACRISVRCCSVSSRPRLGISAAAAAAAAASSGSQPNASKKFGGRPFYGNSAESLINCPATSSNL